MNEFLQNHTGVARFDFDWQKLPKIILAETEQIIGTNCAYEGTHIYTSFDPRTDGGKKHGNWAKTWLDRQPGVQVDCCERKPKRPPQCNHCHQPIETCPLCAKDIAGTVEKGVDTAIVTDMIRLAWEDSYDIGVIVSSDADMIPAVKFLDQRGYKIVQAGFPPKGIDLATTCWASIDLFKCRDKFKR